MEDTHWAIDIHIVALFGVLILVLMEDTHWDGAKSVKNLKVKGLNPCFNGRYSLRSFKISCSYSYVRS